MSRKLPVKQFVQAVMKSYILDAGLEPRLLGHENFRIIDASTGRVDFELDIQKQHLNRLQIIHGGTLSSLVDLAGSLAVASMGRWMTGISTDLNVTFLNPGGKAGDSLRGTAICEKFGKSLAYTNITLNNNKGQLAARGSHTKYVANTVGDEGPYVAPLRYIDEVD